jgi:hypothetical protein
MFPVSCPLTGWEESALRRLQTAALAPCRTAVLRPFTRPGAVRHVGRGLAATGHSLPLNPLCSDLLLHAEPAPAARRAARRMAEMGQ